MKKNGLFLVFSLAFTLTLALPEKFVYHVPVDADTGHVVTVLPMRSGQLTRVVPSHRQVGRPPFAVLRQGELITTRRLVAPTDGMLSVNLEHTLGRKTWRDTLVVVCERKSHRGEMIGHPYQGFISEDAPPGSHVQGITQLTSSVSHLPYGCDVTPVTGDTHMFTFTSSGNVVTKAKLDREAQSSYYLTLRTRCHNVTSYASVRLRVVDVNDNPPRFTDGPASQYISVRSHSACQKPLIQLRATDPDLYDPLTFTLSSEGQETFRLDTQNNVVCRDGVTQLMPGTTYEIKSVVIDGVGHKSQPITIRISVDDLDPSRFWMDNVHHRASRALADTAVFPVRRSYPGPDIATVHRADDTERFHFRESDEPEGLELDAVTGVISRGDDHEWPTDNTSISFMVDVTAEGDDQVFDTIDVTIELVDRLHVDHVFINQPAPLTVRLNDWVRPETLLLTLIAQDTEDYGVKVKYMIESGGRRDFVVDADTGELTVSARKQFTVGDQYQITVSAVPEGVIENREHTPAQIINILVNDIAPQFVAEDSYVLEMTESTGSGEVVVLMAAKSFQIFSIQYSMESSDGLGEFSIDGTTGAITLENDLEHIRDIQQYRKEVTAVEDVTDMTSTVEVVINVAGENLYTPYFPPEVYIKRGVREDININETILGVQTIDLDQGANGEVTFICEDDHFRVDTDDMRTGRLVVNRPLDYDWLYDHVYEFTLTAIDHGVEPRSASTTVQVWMENVNDEPPHFEPPHQQVRVNEDSNEGVILHVIQAFDPDGGTLTFKFDMDDASDTVYKFCTLDPDKGHIILNEKLTMGTPSEVLTIEATDGYSGSNGAAQTASVTVLIDISGVNTPPTFPDCGTYEPDVLEGEPHGTSVINVTATDGDSGLNGEITYSLVWDYTLGSPVFELTEFTDSEGVKHAELTTALIFDREKPEDVAITFGDVVLYEVTVQATDSGDRPLSTNCFFFVKITDINDNAPLFDRTPYNTALLPTTATDVDVIRVYALDDDADDNAKVSYEITNDDECPSCFKFDMTADDEDKNRAWLKVDNSDALQGHHTGETVTVTITVIAYDNPADIADRRSLEVEVKVTLETDLALLPAWWEDVDENSLDELEINLMENVTKSGIYSLDLDICGNSHSGNDSLSRHLQRDRTLHQNKDGDFSMRNLENNCAELRATRLNFETTAWYSLRLTLSFEKTSNNLETDARLRVLLTDVNDQIPYFVGVDSSGKYPAAVTPNTKAGEDVVTVTAIDRDGTSPNNLVTYKFSDSCSDCDKFTIDGESGVISSFDDYDQDDGGQQYTLYVVAEDGAPSALQDDGQPNRVEITVTVEVVGASDEQPVFNQATFDPPAIDEASAYNTTIAYIRADHHDNPDVVTQYHIVEGLDPHRFGYDMETGRLFVMSQVYYDTQETYLLRCRVFDGTFQDYTDVTVTLEPRNLHPPVFDQDEYDVENITEHDNNLPHTLGFVSATDPSGGGALTYDLAGVHIVGNRFVIDSVGIVTLNEALDRDYPEGFANWQINVVAHDDPTHGDSRAGYAMLNLRLQDRNDNPPYVDTCCVDGGVLEHQSANSHVMFVVARDMDAGDNAVVNYTATHIPQESGSPVFALNTATGEVTTLMELDREVIDSYVMEVVVADQPTTGQSLQSRPQKLYISVRDENDHAPVFLQDNVEIQMPEEMEVGSLVGYVFAQDDDIGVNAKLDYSIPAGDADGDSFYMDSIYVGRTGAIKIDTVVDYESLADPTLQFSVVVQDPDPTHTATVTVTVIVLDINDPPRFTLANQAVNISENTPVGELVAEFEATDQDSGDRGQFQYIIDYPNTDPDQHFAVGADTGEVTIRNQLDYETETHQEVHILAIDQGDPQATGTATLLVTVTDNNDNAPALREEYNFQVGKDTSSGEVIAEFYADDRDSDMNGPPFTFADNCGSESFCSDFTFQSFPDPDGRDGYGQLVTARDGYDRTELGMKSYEYPVTCTDDPESGEPSMTRDINVKITIKSYNDYPSEPGHKDILVYNYKRQLGDTDIGYVYVNDEDDWDRHEKTYEFEGDHEWFTLGDYGMLIMQQGAPRGLYSLQVRVADDYGDVISTVDVDIRYIEEEPVKHSASVRFTGCNALQFIRRDEVLGFRKRMKRAPVPSLYRTFVDIMAELLGTNAEHIHLFSVRDTTPPNDWEEHQDAVDVMLAAHAPLNGALPPDTVWYRPSKINGLMWQHKDMFEAEMGLTLEMSPIDLCIGHTCWTSGCYTDMDITTDPDQLFGNSTSVVNVDVSLQPQCECGPTTFETEVTACDPNPCLNGGSCVDYWNGMRCDCPDGFTGPRCQQMKLGFQGDGWAWVEPLLPCQEGKTSLQLMTTQADALLLYNGPMTTDDIVFDFFLLELVGGYPKVRVDMGDGELVLEITGRNEASDVRLDPLNDGTWHSIELFKNGKEFRLVVDHCTASVTDTQENIDDSTSDRTSCEAVGSTPGEEILLHLYTPLQIGGVSEPDSIPLSGINNIPYAGCIKELMHDGIFYDLEVTSKGEWSGSVEGGCPVEEGCEDVPENSTCVGSVGGTIVQITCLPGTTGDQCDQEAPVKDFISENSYISWGVKDSWNTTHSTYASQVMLSFRTRQTDGVIFVSPSFSGLERLWLQIEDSHLVLLYDLGDGDRMLSLPYVNVSDGWIHVVRVSRHGNQVTLQLDGGEGRFTAETQPEEAHRLMVVGNAFGAADVVYPNHHHVEPLLSNVLVDSCISDVRYSDEAWPMDEGEESESVVVETLQDAVDGCESDACSGVICPAPQECEDYWRMPQCVCPVGILPGDPLCPAAFCPMPYCPYGDCVDIGDDFYCHCWPGYTQQDDKICVGGVGWATVATLSTEAIIIILLCLLILIILVLIYLCLAQRKQEGLLTAAEPPDMWENVMEYEEEGFGEEDENMYDMERLKKPLDPAMTTDAVTFNQLGPMVPEPMSEARVFALPTGQAASGDLHGVLSLRLHDTNKDQDVPPFDSVMAFEYEGEGSLAGTLSSLGTNSSDQDVDFEAMYNDLGPSFKHLADLYRGDEDLLSQSDDTPQQVASPGYSSLVAAPSATASGSGSGGGMGQGASGGGSQGALSGGADGGAESQAMSGIGGAGMIQAGAMDNLGEDIRRHPQGSQQRGSHHESDRGSYGSQRGSYGSQYGPGGGGMGGQGAMLVVSQGLGNESNVGESGYTGQGEEMVVSSSAGMLGSTHGTPGAQNVNDQRYRDEYRDEQQHIYSNAPADQTHDYGNTEGFNHGTPQQTVPPTRQSQHYRSSTNQYDVIYDEDIQPEVFREPAYNDQQDRDGVFRGSVNAAYEHHVDDVQRGDGGRHGMSNPAYDTVGDDMVIQGVHGQGTPDWQNDVDRSPPPITLQNWLPPPPVDNIDDSRHTTHTVVTRSTGGDVYGDTTQQTTQTVVVTKTETRSEYQEREYDARRPPSAQQYSGQSRDDSIVLV